MLLIERLKSRPQGTIAAFRAQVKLISRRSPTKAETSDRAIEGAVARELDWDPEVSAAHVGVSANDGPVVLTETVSSYAERV